MVINDRLSVVIFFFLCANKTLATPKEVIQKYDFQNDGSGTYSFDVATGDDETKRTNVEIKQEGHLKNPNTDNEILAVSGSFTYDLDDRVRISVTYTADENGYRPKVTWTSLVDIVNRFVEDEDEQPVWRSGISSAALGTLVGGNGK